MLYLIDGYKHPIKEGFHGEFVALLGSFVKNRVLECHLPGDVFVEHQGKDGKHGEDSRISQQQKAVVDGYRHEKVLNAEDGLHDGDNCTAVDDELRKERAAFVG
jgi:hypothetical protein